MKENKISIPKSKSFESKLQSKDKQARAYKLSPEGGKRKKINNVDYFNTKTEKYYLAEDSDEEEESRMKQYQFYSHSKVGNRDSKTNSIISDNDKRQFIAHLDSSVSILDQIINYCGIKFYHFKIIICQFIQLLYYGFQMVTLSTITIPYYKYMDFGLNQIKILVSVLYLGAALGSASIGFQYKIINNRRTLLRLNFIISIVFTFFFSLSCNFWLSLICRFIIGFTLGFIQPVHNNIMTEILPHKLQNFIMISLISATMIGNFVPLIFELVIMPTVDYRGIPNLLLSMALLMFFIFILFNILTEDSPKNLFFQKDKNKAFEILEKSVITSDYISIDPLKEVIISQSYNETINKEEESYSAMFKKNYLWVSLSNISLLSGHYYISYGLQSIQNFVAKDAADREEDINPTDEITNQIIMNVLSLLTPIIAALVSEFKIIGMKLALAIGHICLTLCFLLIFFNRENLISYISIANSITAFNSCIIYCLISTTYPIKMKDKSVGITFLIGKSFIIITIIVSISLVKSYSSVNYFIYLILSAWNTVIMFIYPQDNTNIQVIK